MCLHRVATGIVTSNASDHFSLCKDKGESSDLTEKAFHDKILNEVWSKLFKQIP